MLDCSVALHDKPLGSCSRYSVLNQTCERVQISFPELRRLGYGTAVRSIGHAACLRTSYTCGPDKKRTYTSHHSHHSFLFSLAGCQGPCC